MARLNSLGEAAPDVATNPTLPLAPDQPLALTDTLDVPIGYAYELHVNLEGGSEAPSLPPEELWLSPEAQPVEMDGLRLLHRDRSRNDQLVPITAEDLEDAEAFFTARYTLIAQFSVGADDGLAERLVCDRLSLHCLECLQNYLHEAQQRFGLTTQQTAGLLGQVASLDALGARIALFGGQGDIAAQFLEMVNGDLQAAVGAYNGFDGKAEMARKFIDLSGGDLTAALDAWESCSPAARSLIVECEEVGLALPADLAQVLAEREASLETVRGLFRFCEGDWSLVKKWASGEYVAYQDESSSDPTDTIDVFEGKIKNLYLVGEYFELGLALNIHQAAILAGDLISPEMFREALEIFDDFEMAHNFAHFARQNRVDIETIRRFVQLFDGDATAASRALEEAGAYANLARLVEYKEAGLGLEMVQANVFAARDCTASTVRAILSLCGGDVEAALVWLEKYPRYGMEAQGRQELFEEYAESGLGLTVSEAGALAYWYVPVDTARDLIGRWGAEAARRPSLAPGLNELAEAGLGLALSHAIEFAERELTAREVRALLDLCAGDSDQAQLLLNKLKDAHTALLYLSEFENITALQVEQFDKMQFTPAELRELVDACGDLEEAYNCCMRLGASARKVPDYMATLGIGYQQTLAFVEQGLSLSEAREQLSASQRLGNWIRGRF